MIENTNLDVKGLPFDIAIRELETIIKRLEQVNAGTAESLAIYKRGEALKRRCEQIIDQEFASTVPPC
jgi:exodeoxyribonuclease VII small subunit